MTLIILKGYSFLYDHLGRYLLSSNNSGQVVHSHMLLTPSSIIWYWPNGGDILLFILDFLDMKLRWA